MIGVDTNVLVRYLTPDDPEQLGRVDRLIAQEMERDEPLYVDAIVLCEVAWVLRSAYRYRRSEIADALSQIVDTGQFSMEERDLGRRGLVVFRDGKGNFADHLIGERNHRAGCEATVTFDRALEEVEHFRAL